MTALAYYNEIDPFNVHLLKMLMVEGVIAYGEVDDQPIQDVQPDDLKQFTQCHFFAGGGLWSVAARIAGWPDDKPLWTGSCPCQPFSVAGKGAGTSDPRHLWPDFHRLIAACRPPVVVGEQVAGKAGYGWFDGVQSDLERAGYASRPADVPACAVDAPHNRQRLYWVAADVGDSAFLLSDGGKRDGTSNKESVGRATVSKFRDTSSCNYWSNAEWRTGADGKARRVKPGVRLLVDGLPGRVDLLRVGGNAIVPALAAQVLAALMETGL